MSCSLFGWKVCSCSCSRKSCSNHWIFSCSSAPETPSSSPTSHPFLSSHPLSHAPIPVAKSDQLHPPLIICYPPTDDEDNEEGADNIKMSHSKLEVEQSEETIDVKKRIQQFNSLLESYRSDLIRPASSVPKRSSSSCSSISSTLTSQVKPPLLPKPLIIQPRDVSRDHSPSRDNESSNQSTHTDMCEENKRDTKYICNTIRKISAPAMRSPSSASSISSASSSAYDTINNNNNGSLIAQLKERLGIRSVVVDERDIRLIVTDRKTNFSDDYEDDDSQLDLEDDGTSSSPGDFNGSETNNSLVNFLKAADNKVKKLFYVAQELTLSEESFVDALVLLNVEFRAVAEKTLPSDVSAGIFKHLNELMCVSSVLLKELQDALLKWPETKKISHILVKVGPFLKIYSSYMGDFEQINKSYDEAVNRFVTFSSALKEFELNPRCKKLSVKHYLLKPVQRIPQYRLLLEDYLRKMSEDHQDYEDTRKALEIVSNVAEHANNAIKTGDSFTKLLTLQNSLVRHHDIIKPGRIFIRKGTLHKVSRKHLQERLFVLCSDCLFYLSEDQFHRGVYHLHHELPLTGMRIHLPDTPHDDNHEFRIFSPARSFIVRAKNEEERQDWYSSLLSAIEDNAKRRKTFMPKDATETKPQNLNALPRDSSLQVSDTNPTSPASFILGEEYPIWIPDERVTMCQVCTAEFTLTFRRHHCRACGKVVCDECSANRVPLKYLNYKQSRVCDECCEKLRQMITQKREKRRSVVSLNEQVNNETSADVEGDPSESRPDSNRLSFVDLDTPDEDELLEKFERVPIRKSNRKQKSIPNALKVSRFVCFVTYLPTLLCVICGNK